MTSYTEVFGGNNINPAQLSYRAVALAADTTLVWPTLAQAGADVVAQKMDVTPAAAGLSLMMPDATLASNGEDVYFNNVGAETFTVKDSAGGTLLTIAAGEEWLLYLRDNSTAAGAWRTLQAGAGSSSAQAAALAGLGLVALSTLLNQSHPVSAKNANYELVANDRASLVRSTGGALTFSFAASSVLGANWFALVRNSGSGNLTLDPDGSETIDGSATKVLAAGEACFVICDGSNLFTVGYGRSTLSTVTAIVVSGGGAAGTQTLSASEVAAEIQEFTGTLTGARAYEYGAVIGYWYVRNSLTLGGNTATWRVDGADPGVTSADLPAGTDAVLKSDGTNMVLAFSAAGGTVTSIATGTGLTGGPITTTGTISLANTAVTPGTYALPTITVDAQGRLTAAASMVAFSVITADPGPAVAGTTYACNTSGGAFTVTLPAAPTAGDTVGFEDARGTFDTASLTIGRNGNPIMSLAADMTVSTEGAAFSLQYVDATRGWVVR